MKLEKKHWIIIAIIVAIILVWYFCFGKKSTSTESNYVKCRPGTCSCEKINRPDYCSSACCRKAADKTTLVGSTLSI